MTNILIIDIIKSVKSAPEKGVVKLSNIDYKMKDERWALYLVTFSQYGQKIEVKVTAVSHKQARNKVFWNNLKNKLSNPPCRYADYDEFVQQSRVEQIKKILNEQPLDEKTEKLQPSLEL